MHRERQALGAAAAVAQRIAASARRWRRNRAMALHCVPTIAYFDRLDVPRLS
jgi:RNA-directed DNA polymerase